MKILKKLVTTVTLFSLLLNSSTAFASGQENNGVIDELWGVPILAHGASLNESQLADVHQILGLTDRSFDSIYVTGSDVVYFLGTGNPNVSMYSSALITRRPADSGIDVSILTPNNITRVTATQYANAMITAGVTDALVEVVSPIPVTGEAALTGIYKAFHERGVVLDEDRMAVAQEQLEVTSSIATYHHDNEDFNAYNLDQAVIEIQSTLADIYQASGELATPADIIEVARTALDSNSLADIITEEQIQQLAGFASNFQLTDAIHSEEFRDQLSNLADRVGNLISNVDTGTLASWWNRLVDWLRSLFN